MNTILNKLNAVQSSKNDIKAAINEKNIVPGDVFAQYPNLIRNIKTNNIKPSLITITQQPQRSIYQAKENFDSAGLRAWVGFSNGIQIPLENGEKMHGYTKLEYIESTGSQYINSGIKWDTNDIRIQGKYSYTSLSGHASIFGTQGHSNGSNLILREESQGSGYLAWWLSNTSTGITSVSNVSNGQIIDYDLNLTNSGTFYFNVMINGDSSQGSGVHNNIYDNNDIYIFDTQISGGRGSHAASTITCKARLYAFKIWKNNVLVCDFIPYKNANGVVGLYDFVTEQFFTNPEGSNFIAGPEVEAAYFYIENGNNLQANQTNVIIFYEESNARVQNTITIKVNPIIVPIPYCFEVILPEDGSATGPYWSDYDPSLININGPESVSVEGTYTTILSLKDKVNYKWVDKTTEDKNFIWNATTLSKRLQDFVYSSSNGNYIITDWKGTYMGQPSTEIIIPDDPRIIL